MKKGSLSLLFLIGIVILGISLYFDEVIVQSLATIRTPLLNDFLVVISSKIFILIAFLILPSFLLKKSGSKFIIPLWISMAVAAALSYLLKIVIARPRPFNLGITATLPSLAKNSHLIWNFSLPSSHAATIFASLIVLWIGISKFKKTRYLLLFLAIIICLSRVYFGLHFLSDVLIGAVFGLSVGWIILKVEKKNSYSNKVFKKIKTFLDNLTKPKRKN